MKDCPKCGYSNHEVDSICYNCGHIFFVENVNNYSDYNNNTQIYNGNNNYNGNQQNFIPQVQSHVQVKSPPVYVKTNGYAKAAFTLGLISIPLKCGVDIILSILSILFGLVAILGIIFSFGKEKGIGYAFAGIVLSCITIFIYVQFVIPYIMERIGK